MNFTPSKLTVKSLPTTPKSRIPKLCNTPKSGLQEKNRIDQEEAILQKSLKKFSCDVNEFKKDLDSFSSDLTDFNVLLDDLLNDVNSDSRNLQTDLDEWKNRLEEMRKEKIIDGTFTINEVLDGTFAVKKALDGTFTVNEVLDGTFAVKKVLDGTFTVKKEDGVRVVENVIL